MEEALAVHEGVQTEEPPVVVELDGVATEPVVPKGRARPGARALIFTMDSITQYEERSRKGGAAGEITIRR